MSKTPRLMHPSAVCLAVGALLSFAAGAQIRTDNSLGKPAQTLAGPAFVIPQTLGMLAGGNLFHSFQTFNLTPGESARFTTSSPGITNVISRVTGGDASNIYGRISLKAASGAPAFTFINPAGVTFGAGASIDVPGAFHVGTADHVSFFDGSRYAADLSRTSSFSTTTPAAFGFLGKQHALLLLDSGAALSAARGQTITLAGGDVVADGGRAASDGGELRATATGRLAQEVPFSGPLPTGGGQLMLLGGGNLSVESYDSGRSGILRVSAAEVLFDGLTSGRTGLFGGVFGRSGGGATIELSASSRFSLRNNTRIDASSSSERPAGSISLRSPYVVVDNAVISVAALAAGKAGEISIDAERIALTSGGQLVASAQSTGSGGRVVLTASESISLSGRDADNFRSGIFVGTAGKAPAGEAVLAAPQIVIRDDGIVNGYAIGGATTATAGRITIKGGDLLLENGGNISVEGYDAMGQGSVTVDLSGSLRIRGKGEARDASPGADTVSTGILGHASEIRITAPEITLSESGAIRSESWYQTRPGWIDINTQRLSLQSGGHISGSALGHSYTYGIGAPIVIKADEYVRIAGNSHDRYSTIESGARSSGGSGSVRVTTPSLRIADGASINTNTGRFGTATAGKIDITVARLELIDGGRLTSVEQGHAVAGGQITVLASDFVKLENGRISAAGENDAGGGRIVIRSPSLRLRGGVISTGNSDHSIPGGIDITANQIALSDASRIESASTSKYGAGSIDLHVGKLLHVSDSAITTTSSAAGGGNITLSGADAVLLSRSQITTSVTGENYDGKGGNGGNITLGARSLALDNGFIQANSVARNAQGGNIGIQVDLLVASGNHLLVGGQTPYAFQSSLAGFNVIQAAAPTGVSGIINISSPALDLSGSVLALSTDLLDLGALGRSPCQPSGGSSLAQIGRGGFAPSARDLLGPLRRTLPTGSVSAVMPSATQANSATSLRCRQTS